MAKVSRSIGLALVVALSSLAAPACSSGPTCIIDGVEHPVGSPFTLLGCGSCMCDSSGDVVCDNPACSSPGHPTDGAASDAGDGATSD
jgi:hypothetical protein